MRYYASILQSFFLPSLLPTALPFRRHISIPLKFFILLFLNPGSLLIYTHFYPIPFPVTLYSVPLTTIPCPILLPVIPSLHAPPQPLFCIPTFLLLFFPSFTSTALFPSSSPCYFFPPQSQVLSSLPSFSRYSLPASAQPLFCIPTFLLFCSSLTSLSSSILSPATPSVLHLNHPPLLHFLLLSPALPQPLFSPPLLPLVSQLPDRLVRPQLSLRPFQALLMRTPVDVLP